MSEKEIHNDLVNRIIESDSFGKSDTYANLLKYLVDCTKTNDIPKETTIGTHLFGLNAAENYDSAKVRVYVFNLRKKLDQYFQNEGQNEECILTIPKGSYKVEMVKKSSAGKKSISLKNPKTLLLISVLLCISIVLNFIFWNKNTEIEKSYEVIPKTKFWNDFIEGERPVLVVLGDLFIYTEQNTITGLRQTIRNSGINSEVEFENYKEKNADSTRVFGDLTYTYLIRNTTDWIESLTKIFYSNHKSFNTRVISRIGAKDIHDHNIVFIGMQKTAGLFNNYFLNSKFSLIDDNTLGYQANPESDIQKFSPLGNPDQFHTDYGFVAKFPGPNNNTIFMFGGIWDTAASQSLKNFTDPELIANLENQMIQKFNKIPQYFEVLFEVSGLDRTELNTKVVHMNEIDKISIVWAEK
ncbi:hypothetical protein [Reichenbachiella sp. MALMAid0571]|uniref:hypothetical protein n=1 Tax=Reichenbachiella sp. MALMAid0571 TaxID=3143939 RepID=UPI0032DFED11